MFSNTHHIITSRLFHFFTFGETGLNWAFSFAHKYEKKLETL